MKIKIIAVGSLKEDFLRKAITYYSQSIKKKHSFEIIEIPDEKAPEKYSEVEIERVKIREGEKILTFVSQHSYIMALDILGKKHTTEDVKKKMEKLKESSYEEMAFIIGGSNGLSSQVLKRANEKISFSPMTFPHQLMRIILVEQLQKVL